MEPRLTTAESGVRNCWFGKMTDFMLGIECQGQVVGLMIGKPYQKCCQEQGPGFGFLVDWPGTLIFCEGVMVKIPTVTNLRCFSW
jgi:hypothetical protein